jgi:hypothetical protein
MRLLTIAGLFLSALSVSAQSAEETAATNELLVELTKLPTCAVCELSGTTFCLRGVADDTNRPLVLRKHFQSRIAPPVILPVFVPTRHILGPARNAFCPAARLKRLCVRSI